VLPDYPVACAFRNDPRKRVASKPLYRLNGRSTSRRILGQVPLLSPINTAFNRYRIERTRTSIAACSSVQCIVS
jgi:hypothetical protein